MKNFFKKHWAGIGVVVAFLIDQQTGLLGKLITDPFWLNFVQMLSALIAGMLWNKSTETANRRANSGGGAVVPDKGF